MGKMMRTSEGLAADRILELDPLGTKLIDVLFVRSLFPPAKALPPSPGGRQEAMSTRKVLIVSVEIGRLIPSEAKASIPPVISSTSTLRSPLPPMFRSLVMFAAASSVKTRCALPVSPSDSTWKGGSSGANPVAAWARTSSIVSTAVSTPMQNGRPIDTGGVISRTFSPRMLPSCSGPISNRSCTATSGLFPFEEALTVTLMIVLPGANVRLTTLGSMSIAFAKPLLNSSACSWASSMARSGRMTVEETACTKVLSEVALLRSAIARSDPLIASRNKLLRTLAVSFLSPVSVIWFGGVERSVLRCTSSRFTMPVGSGSTAEASLMSVTTCVMKRVWVPLTFGASVAARCRVLDRITQSEVANWLITAPVSSSVTFSGLWSTVEFPSTFRSKPSASQSASVHRCDCGSASEISIE
mmetsp:Transcript_22221/g.54375  ORF Transcript_22221/g.54375 Transcript_22221/m.54375 type:complete len:414 (+) Transcript_22221:324-1565(+)